MTDVLLIGATGFIGRETARLLSGTDVRLRILVHRTRPDIPLGNRVELLHGGIQSFDWKTLNDDPPDTIIHMARISGRYRLTRYWAGIRGYQANKKLVAWASSLKNPPHIIYTSGTLVYGSRGEMPVDEFSEIQPTGFQRSYMTAEIPFLNDSGMPGSRISIVRPSWVYGPDSWFRQFYYHVMMRDGIVPQYGTGENYMSLVSLTDCTRMIAETARQTSGGAVYNLYVGEPLRQHEFCGILSRLSGKQVRVFPEEWLLDKYGPDATEALTFSLIVKSVHPLITGYKSIQESHSSGLRNTLDQLNQ